MSLYNDRKQRFFGNAREQELLMLIWGPGDPGEAGSPEATEGYKKRCQIRRALQENFPRSEIKFSEELDIDETMGLLRGEAVQAKIFDAVIILPISHGSYFELYYYSGKYSWFREKVWVLAPEEYLDTKSIAAEVLKLFPNKVSYTVEEFKRCDTTKKSVNIATAVAVDKLLI